MASRMSRALAMIGFGEAARTFAQALDVAITAYDRKTDDPALAGAKHADFAAAGVAGCVTAAEALAGSPAVLSLVTSDQALVAALAAAPLLAGNAFFFDMNSVAPDTKRAAAAAIERAGGRYVDVAILAPVQPAAAQVPMLLSGPHAEDGAAMLRAMGFGNVRAIPGDVGRASSIKMIRSVMVKGIEALTTECVLAADAAGVLGEVLDGLDATPPPPRWRDRADYNLDRMLVHGLRRAAEMEEVVKTLDALGTGSVMARATVERQRAIGAAGRGAAPAGIAAKLAALALKAAA